MTKEKFWLMKSEQASLKLKYGDLVESYSHFIHTFYLFDT